MLTTFINLQLNNFDNLFEYTLPYFYYFNSASKIMTYDILDGWKNYIIWCVSEWTLKNILNLYIIFYQETFFKFIVNRTIWVLFSVEVNYDSLLCNHGPFFFRFVFYLLRLSLYSYIYMVCVFSGNNLKLKIKIFTILINIFILNETEKELGSMDDYLIFFYFFIFIFNIFILAMWFNLFFFKMSFTWVLTGLTFVVYLIITIPLSTFYDIGFRFINYIKGSSSSSNVLIEILFDIIAISTVIIRFIIQNIRFVFIFGSIFELFEWVFFSDSTLFFNSFIVDYLDNNKHNISLYNNNLNIFILNLIFYIIYYFYCSLHFIFLLFIQLTIYILISIWLFFFLYTSFFITKNEKFLLFKKLLKI